MKLINCNVPRVVYSDDYSKYFDLEPESSQPEPEPAKPPSTPLSTAADYPEELEPTNDVLPHLTPPKLGWKAQRAVMKARRSMPEPRHEPIEATESSDFVKEYIENHGDLYMFTESDTESTKHKKALALRESLTKKEQEWNKDSERYLFAYLYGYGSGRSAGLAGVDPGTIEAASNLLWGNPTFQDPFSLLDETKASAPISKLIQWRKMETPVIQSEAVVVSKITPYTMGFFDDLDLEEEMSVPLGTPTFSRLFGSDPAPDYVVRIRQEELGNWPRQLRPCVFVQETKTRPSRIARAQLAMSCVTTLLIITRMFTYVHQPGYKMPAWMVIHGIVHTREGFTWYAHFPRAVPIELQDGKFSWKWEWVSQLVTDTFTRVFLDHTPIQVRMMAYSAFLVIRSHGRQLATHLKNWIKESAQCGKGVMDDIIASVYDQLGELEDNASNFVFE